MSEHLALLEARRAGLRAELQAVETAIRTLGGAAETATEAVGRLASSLQPPTSDLGPPDGRRYRPRRVPMTEVAYLVKRFNAAIANGPISFSALRRSLGIDYADAVLFAEQMAAKDPSIKIKGDGRGRRIGAEGQDFSAAFRASQKERSPAAIEEARAILALIDKPMTITELGARLEQASLNGARWRLAEMLKDGRVKRVGRYYLTADMEAPEGLAALNPIARDVAMTVVAVLEAAGQGLRMDSIGPKLTNTDGTPLSLAGYRRRVANAVKLGLVKKTGNVYHLDGQALPPTVRQIQAAAREEAKRRRLEARAAAEAAPPAPRPARAPRAPREPRSEVRSQKVSAPPAPRGATVREVAEASGQSLETVARRLKFSRGKRDDQGDDLAKRRIMEFLSLEDLTVPELATKIKRTASEAARLLLELHAERKVRRVGALAWATRFAELTDRREDLAADLETDAGEAVFGVLEAGNSASAAVSHLPAHREADDFEPFWNASLERQGLAPGLSSHRGSSTLAAAGTASMRGVDHVGKV